MRILLAEDDRRIADDISSVLSQNGFVVDHVSDGEEAWYRGDTVPYAGAILDIGLPVMDGLSVLRRWRDNGRTIPVLLLTARGSWTDRVEGINLGADDYLPKPFQMDELLARLRAVIRRSHGHAAPSIRCGDVVVDPRQMKVTRQGEPIQLSPQEYRLVSYLFYNAGRVVPQQELAEHLQSVLFERESNAIEVLVGRARRKLGVGVIETRRGLGYLVTRDDTA